MTLNARNLDIGGDRVENLFRRAVSLPLQSPIQNIVVQCGTNNISTDSPRDIADCIVDVGTIFRKKSNTVNIIICGLIPCDECWSVNRLLINKVNDILKYECHKNVDNFFKGYVLHDNFSRNKFLNYDSFIYHDVNIFNISHTNVLSSSDHFYPFSFYFCKYSFFLYTVFLMIYFN